MINISVSHAATTGLPPSDSTERESAGHVHRVRLARCLRRADPAAPRRAALLHSANGVYDQGTGLAVDAYHRLLRWGTAQTLDHPTIARLLDGTGAFHVRFPGHGRHAEGDLTLQLLALANGSRVEAIYPISSGKPSTPTILGDFQVYSKVPGYLPDGMYYSNFFIRRLRDTRLQPGARLSRQSWLYAAADRRRDVRVRWLAIGDWVDTYY